MADIYEALAKKLNGTTVDYGSLTANQLSDLLARPASGQRTEEQLRASGENKYASLYNQKNLAANQQYEATENSIQNQLASLADAYSAQKKQMQKNTASSLSTADRYALQRGMGRSSYNLANMANIQNAGNEALQGVYAAETNERNSLNSNLSLAKQQLAQILSSYGVGKETDILSYMDEQRESDYAKALEELQYRNELEMTLAEFAKQYGGASGSGGGGGGGGGGSGSRTIAKPKTTPTTPPVDDALFLNGLLSLNGGKNAPTGMTHFEATDKAMQELAGVKDEIKSGSYISKVSMNNLLSKQATLEKAIASPTSALQYYDIVNGAIKNPVISHSKFGSKTLGKKQGNFAVNSSFLKSILK